MELNRRPPDRLLPLLFFTATFVFLLRPVGAEQDFWWHLATGKWILEHNALPVADPFALFPVPSPDSHDLLILRGYWLSQIVYYLLYHAGGLLAICLLGALVMTGTCLLVWATLRQHLPVAQSLLATTPLVIACRFFSEHRPQLFSFLFFALLIYLLERATARFRSAGAVGLSAWLVPPAMVLWAQLHPGYAIAFPLIAIYAGVIVAKPGGSRREALTLRLILYGSVLAAMISPVGPRGVQEMVAILLDLLPGSPDGRLALVTIDNTPPWSVAATFGPWYWRLLAASLTLSLAAAFVARSTVPRRFMAMAALFAVPALVSFRFGPFFFIAAAPLAGQFVNRATLMLPPAIAAAGNFGASCVVAALLLVTGIRTGVTAQGLFTPSLVSDQAVRFLLDARIPGGIAAPYSWGGYLIWNVWPTYRIFVDQRGLGGKEALERYEGVVFQGDTEQLDRMGIKAVVFNPVDPVSGSVYYGFLSMMESGRWDLAYSDGVAAIFVRSSLGLPLGSGSKAELLQRMITELERWQRRAPGDPTPHLLLGQIRFWQGDFPAAEQSFTAAALLDPADPRGGKWLDALRNAGSAPSGRR